MKFPKVTIKTIANKLDVSVGTVSYVLNGQAGKRRISNATAKKIKDTVKEMGTFLITNGYSTVSMLFSGFELSWADRIMDGGVKVFGHVDYKPLLGGEVKNRMLSVLEMHDCGVTCELLN